MTLTLEGDKEEIEEFLKFLEENKIVEDIEWLFDSYTFNFKDKEYYRDNVVKQDIEINYSEAAKVRSAIIEEIKRRDI